MLTTVHPSLRAARSSAFSAPAGVGELALVVVVEQQQPQRGAAAPRRTAASAMSPFELPAAKIGRRPIRLQIRTGFSGPVVEEVQLRLADDRAAVPSSSSKRRPSRCRSRARGGMPYRSSVIGRMKSRPPPETM